MKRLARFFLSGGCALLLQTAVAADTPPPAAAVKAALAVNVTQPTTSTWNTSIPASGTLSAWQEAVIAAEIGGQRIAKLLVDVGDKVTQGQELAVLAQESVQAEVAQAQARVAQAQASLTEARTNARRAQGLKQNGALAGQQIDQYVTGEATAQANLAAQQAALQIQQIRLKQTRIVAADDGVISARSASLGAVVQVGTELFRLVRQNRIEWYAEVTGRDLALIKVGQAARLTLPGGETVTGEVRMLAPTLNANTRNALVYIKLDPNSPAKVGMFAQGEILIGAAPTLSVPQTAVVLRDGNSYVFEMGRENRVTQRLVQSGRRIAGRVEILAGLAADATILASGGGFLNDGDTVRVIETLNSGGGAQP